MNLRWLGPLALLAALVIGDQIRINRPGHKYRLTVEVETPEGVKSASGIMAVHPDRSYSRGGRTRTKGDAVWLDLGGGKNLFARKNVPKMPVVQILYHLVGDHDRILWPPPAGRIFQDAKLDGQTIASLFDIGIHSAGVSFEI